MSHKLVQIWHDIIVGDKKSWVLFENGTCVILMEPSDDLKEQAIALMKEYGPVHAGGSAGDFSVTTLTEYPGWVVHGHHPDMLNYVAPDEVEDDQDVYIGLLGRSKRDEDARALKVIHVENKI